MGECYTGVGQGWAIRGPCGGGLGGLMGEG